MPSMSPWLSNKVIKSLPFQFTGLDYFGPLYIKSLNHVDKRKVWVCLFTCVDVTEIDVSFISRRGKLQQIIWDNAPRIKLMKSCCLGKRNQGSRCSITYHRTKNQMVVHNPTISMDGRIL